MRIKVKYMAAAREITGCREEIIETDDSCTLLTVLRLLSEKHGLKMRDYLFDSATGKPRPHLRFLLEDKSVSTDKEFETTLTGEHTLLIVPPVSGG